MAIPKKWLNVLGDIIERLQHVERLLGIRRDSSVCLYPTRNGFYAVSTVDPIPIILAWFDGKWIWPNGTNKEFQCPEDIVNYSFIEEISEPITERCGSCGSILYDGLCFSGMCKNERPLLSDAQVGWVCTRRDGLFVEIVDVGMGKPRYGYRYKSPEGGIICVNEDGAFLSKSKESPLDIVSCEPLAKEGTAEWGKQRALLGNIVTLTHNEIYKIENGKLYEAFPNNDFDVWRLVAEDGVGYWDKWIHDQTGWQIYEPVEPPKEPEYIGYRKDENGKEIDVPGYQEQLEKFVVGARARILSYGGNLAKSGDVGVITSVQPHEGWIGIHLDSNIDVLVNYTCAEPVEPAPRLKVGDFVEHNDSKEQARITHIASPAYDAIEVRFTMSEELEVYSLSEFMIEFHVIPKSEVKVTLTLEGTVERIDEFSFNLEKDGVVAELDYELLSPAQVEMVRELVED